MQNYDFKVLIKILIISNTLFGLICLPQHVMCNPYMSLCYPHCSY